MAQERQGNTDEMGTPLGFGQGRAIQVEIEKRQREKDQNPWVLREWLLMLLNNRECTVYEGNTHHWLFHCTYLGCARAPDHIWR